MANLVSPELIAKSYLENLISDDLSLYKRDRCVTVSTEEFINERPYYMNLQAFSRLPSMRSS